MNKDNRVTETLIPASSDDGDELRYNPRSGGDGDELRYNPRSGYGIRIDDTSASATLDDGTTVRFNFLPSGNHRTAKLSHGDVVAAIVDVANGTLAEQRWADISPVIADNYGIAVPYLERLYNRPGRSDVVVTGKLPSLIKSQYRRWTKEMIDAVIADYADNLPVSQIAKRHRLTEQRVQRTVDEYLQKLDNLDYYRSLSDADKEAAFIASLRSIGVLQAMIARLK